MIVRWKAVEQYFKVLLFGFQFYPLCNFEKFISVGLALSGVTGLTGCVEVLVAIVVRASTCWM